MKISKRNKIAFILLAVSVLCILAYWFLIPSETSTDMYNSIYESGTITVQPLSNSEKMENVAIIFAIINCPTFFMLFKGMYGIIKKS